MGRAPCCDKATVKKGPWSPEEDAVLKSYIEEHGTGGNWIALPHKIGLKRCGKSCRLRWLNYLRPNIKHGDFTPEEDSIICSLYISIGSRWSIIAAQLPGRTDNDVKNYWNTKLKKRLLGRRKDRDHRQGAAAPGGGGAANVDGERCAQALSASAMERIQLCMQLQEQQNPLAAAVHHHGPPFMWPPGSAAAATTQSNATSTSGGGSLSVTVAEPGPSGSFSLDDGHLPGPLDAAVMDADLASPLSPGHSNVTTIEAELQKLLYADGGRSCRDGAAGGGVAQQGDVDWPWSYDQDKSPVSCWDFAPDTTSVFQDYASVVYDI